MGDKQVVLCENVRFHMTAKRADADEALSKKMAALCDVYVMDAFGTAHRAQASTHGVAKYAAVSPVRAHLLSRRVRSIRESLGQSSTPNGRHRGWIKSIDKTDGTRVVIKRGGSA